MCDLGWIHRSDSLKEGLAFLGLAVVFFLIAYLIGLPTVLATDIDHL